MPYDDQKWQREAKERHVPFAQVKALAGELARRNRELHAPYRELRMEVWSRYGTRMKQKYRTAFDTGDLEQIPGFDCCAQELQGAYPHLISRDDPAAELFEILKPPATMGSDWEQAYSEALEALAGPPIPF